MSKGTVLIVGHHTPEELKMDAIFLKGLDYETTSDPSKADYILRGPGALFDERYTQALQMTNILDVLVAPSHFRYDLTKVYFECRDTPTPRN